MNADVNEYLDGERDFDDLSSESQTDAEVWERLTRELRADEEIAAPVWMENAVMSEIALQNAPKESVLGWLLRPRTIRLSPMTGLALAGAAAIIVALLPEESRLVTPPGPMAATQILVEFSLEAPEATTVAVAGDFSDWATDFVLDDADGDGIWTGRIPLSPGLHKYMFVVDGTEWVTDPHAQRYADDGFGNRNAVLAVAPGTTS